MKQNIVLPIFSIITALIIGAFIIRLCGYDFVAAYIALLQGSFADTSHLNETLLRATPLIFTAISYAIASKSGIINLGAEGQLYMGALFATIIGTADLGLSLGIHLFITICFAFIGGGLYGMLAMWLKNTFGANELITTIMLNYIAIYLVSFFVTGPLQDPDTTFIQSKKILETAMYPKIVSSGRLHFGFLLALLFLFLYKFFFQKTVSGFQMRIVGKSYDAARYAGIDYRKKSMLAMFLAGGAAGLAGSCEILGIQGKLVQNFSSNLGFEGIAVALLGNENPLGILLSAVLFGGLSSGSSMMSMKADVPGAVVNIIQAVIILMIAGRQIFIRFTEKIKFRTRKEG